MRSSSFRAISIRNTPMLDLVAFVAGGCPYECALFIAPQSKQPASISRSGLR